MKKRHLALATLLFLPLGCSDSHAPAPTSPAQPSWEIGVDECVWNNPCEIEGVASAVDPDAGVNDPTPCGQLLGGCVNPNDPNVPVIWSNQGRGGTWANKAPGGVPSSRPPNFSERSDIEVAIKDFTKCTAQGNDLMDRLRDGRILVVDDPNWPNYGSFVEDEDAIYIWVGHWDSYGNLKSATNLGETVVHESVHAWWGNDRTGGHPPEFYTILAECS